MSDRNWLHNTCRHIKYFSTWLFEEKVRGLDFTMNQLFSKEEAKKKKHFHGYAKSDERHVRDIFESIDVQENDKLLDIGCGKGVILREACRYPFAKIAGIEMDPELCGIAEKNFRILALDRKISVYHANALEFDRYSEFNVFYLYNPFDETVLSPVIDKIVATKTEKITIIYSKPTCAHIIEEKGGVLIKKMFDRSKLIDTYIYQIV